MFYSLVFSLIIGLFPHQNLSKYKLINNETRNLPLIGEKIQGDFNGDGIKETAKVVKTKNRIGNPIEDGIAEEYEIQFSDPNLKSIKVGCCEVRLINEGDLNNDKTDEISIFQAPMNGCTYSMTTYSFVKGDWIQLVKTFLISTACEDLSDKELQERIFKENNSIYFLDVDPNDKTFKLVKRKLK